LARFTNAGWLVIQDDGAADDGLFARAETGCPLVWDRKRNTLVEALDTEALPSLSGDRRLTNGRRVVPAFELIARRYLDPSYAPEAVAAKTDIPAATIKRLAAELAHIAFDEAIVLEQPWTDWTGRRHARMIGRPISMHAMRGISAHSNGFHTCRAL